jgi:L-iditol 2-dehydrogenase
LEWKRNIAVKVGADLVLDPAKTNVVESVRTVTRVGADVVIECAGRADTVRLALELARRGGTVELFGVCPREVSVPVEPNAVFFKELTIVGSYVNPHTFDRSIALLVQNKVSVGHFVIEKFPLDGVHDALKSLRDGKTIKSLIVPS